MSSTNKTAIVLIDPYNDFLHPEGKVYPLMAESIADTNTITHLQNLVTTARAQKIPIYYGLHQQTKAGYLAGWKHATLTQQSQKENNVFAEGSSFSNTDLDYQLKQRDITHLIFAGLTANTCMESTARYAYELGYHVTMLTDATAGFTTVAKDAATSLIWSLFANEVLTVEEWKKTL
ncbi:isochorismatase hydrolase [Botrytis cinerea]